MSKQSFKSGSNDDIELAEKDPLQSSGTSSGSKMTNLSVDGSNVCIRILSYPGLVLSSFFSNYMDFLKICFTVLLVVGYVVYFIIALVYNATAAIPLVIFTSVITAILLYEHFKKQYHHDVSEKVKKTKTDNENSFSKFQRAFRIITILLAIGVTCWLVIDVILHRPKQLISLLGFLVIIMLCICGSKFPTHINWRVVTWGIAMQFILGLLVLRTDIGYSVIRFIGDQVATFMSYSDAGASFVFGDAFRIHFFAFKVLPMIVFFSTVMNMLYHIGLMQWFIGKLSYITQITLGTSAIESTVAAANIFVGMTEAPLVVRPYLPDLTKAEIHSVLTAGLGSIAFSVFGAYVEFKIDSVHLLTACVMSAPASLVVSRILYPEREKSKFLKTNALALTSGTNNNLVEAAAAGASMSIKLVANIAANLIGFLALLALIDSILSWFGSFVGIPDLSFEIICGYLFMPVAFLMGADWEDCLLVGQLFGVKTFLNEFIAYESMEPYIERRLSGSPKYNGTDILYMSERSEVIAIHALCGFCNISSIGIIIGGLGVLMPSRRGDIAKMAVRSLIGGMFTCCMTASIAGFLFMEKAELIAVESTMNATHSYINNTFMNTTHSYINNTFMNTTHSYINNTFLYINSTDASYPPAPLFPVINATMV